MNKNSAICDANTCFMCQNCLKEWQPAVALGKKNIKLKKGEVLFKEGDPVTGVYFVYAGSLKVYKQWDEDKELIIRFAKDGAMVGHRGLGNNFVYPISAAALEPSVVCFIDTKLFEATLKTNAEFGAQLLQFFAEELCESEKKMRNLAHMPVKGRVADALLHLSELFGEDDKGFIGIDLSRQDLASFAGATYETVFRMINELVKEKLIRLSGKSIAIADREGLAKLAAC
ncbi:MAG: Crp/Fnr family transcriptional regulator [Bacteroidetes bacterium]|nr:Crp/Fnr family transcriptional regulator [Bacteroidota bacterium]